MSMRECELPLRGGGDAMSLTLSIIKKRLRTVDLSNLRKNYVNLCVVF